MNISSEKLVQILNYWQKLSNIPSSPSKLTNLPTLLPSQKSNVDITIPHITVNVMIINDLKLNFKKHIPKIIKSRIPETSLAKKLSQMS